MRPLLGVAWLLLANVAWAQVDPLPSWNGGAAKKAVIEFVSAVTAKDGKGFVSPPERIAVFDNDGTLWREQPMYVQLAFVLAGSRHSRRSTRSGRTGSHSPR